MVVENDSQPPLVSQANKLWFQVLGATPWIEVIAPPGRALAQLQAPVTAARVWDFGARGPQVAQAFESFQGCLSSYGMFRDEELSNACFLRRCRWNSQGTVERSLGHLGRFWASFERCRRLPSWPCSGRLQLGAKMSVIFGGVERKSWGSDAPVNGEKADRRDTERTRDTATYCKRRDNACRKGEVEASKEYRLSTREDGYTPEHVQLFVAQEGQCRREVL